MAKGETIKNYQEGLKENMVGFTNELTKVFPDLKITSGFRKKAFTKQGNVSRHALGEAIDIEARQDVYDYLWNTKDGITLVDKYNLGILDETNPETLKKTGGTGVHYHIGADSTLVPKAQQRYKELVGEKQTTPTTPLTNFDIPTINRSFASVPDSPKEETKKEEKPSEALNQLKEQEFVKQYKSLFTQPQVVQQEQEVNQPIQTADLQGIFNQVSQFVDGDVAQQGGKKPIYVTDKNDPRYRAYQDSLSLYNNAKAKEDKFRKYAKIDDLKIAKQISDDFLPTTNSKIAPTGRLGFLWDNGKGYVQVNKGYTNKAITDNAQEFLKSNNYIRNFAEEYKKPTQAVILEEQRPKVQGLNTNITPAGIQTQQELPQGEELQQINYTQIPTSFDVSSQRYNMQGENPYYNFNEKNVDMQTAIRANLSAENYNADIERRYGNEEALKNPKAVERLNRLRQDINVIPNYQYGGEIEESDLPNPVNGIVFKPEGGRTYYDDRLDRIVLTPQSDFAPRQAVINHEKFHKYQFDNGLSNFDIAQNTDESTWARMQKRPQLPTTDEVYYGFHDRKGRENQIDIDRVKQNETLGFVPDDIIYDKIVDRQQYENEYSLEGEATEYERSLYKQSGGKIIKDNNGYWNPNNWGKTVQIDGGDITMKGVNQILEGYSPETGERKLMFPNFDYKFSRAKRVIEKELKPNEIEFLKNIKK